MGDSNLNFPLQTVPLLRYPGAPVHPGSSAGTLHLTLKGSPRGKEGRSPRFSFRPDSALQKTRMKPVSKQDTHGLRCHMKKAHFLCKVLFIYLVEKGRHLYRITVCGILQVMKHFNWLQHSPFHITVPVVHEGLWSVQKALDTESGDLYSGAVKADSPEGGGVIPSSHRRMLDAHSLLPGCSWLFPGQCLQLDTSCCLNFPS